MNMLFIFSSIFMVLLASSSVEGLLSTSNPPLYAIDIYDGYGVQIFRKVPLRNNCLIYRSIDQNSTNLVFSYGEWLILNTTDIFTRSNGNCFVNGGNILFLQEGESLSSEGWFDIHQNISNVNLEGD